MTRPPDPPQPGVGVETARITVDSADRRVLEVLITGATSAASISEQLNIPVADVLSRLRTLRRTFDATNNLALAASVVRSGLV